MMAVKPKASRAERAFFLVMKQKEKAEEAQLILKRIGVLFIVFGLIGFTADMAAICVEIPNVLVFSNDDREIRVHIDPHYRHEFTVSLTVMTLILGLGFIYLFTALRASDEIVNY